MKFVDREKELETLEAEYARDTASLVVLYGRRRVGKTALCTAFMQGKNAMYFLATEESETQNRNQFKELAAEYLHNPLLKGASVDNWDLLFDTIAQTPCNQKRLIILDEFQYLGKSNPAFPSIFQRIWERLKAYNIMVILCGSLITMMEAQTLHYSSPLYGRRTAQIKLKQIPFRYYHEFFPDKDRREQIEYYSVTGGVPKYIELFHADTDIYRAIQKNILNKSSFLYDEPTFLLQNEVSEVGSYFSIIRTIAQGNHKLSKIAGALEVKQTNLSKYLKTLIDLDILEREVPVTEKEPEKSKRGLYKIRDNFLLFWFRFVYPNLGFIESDQEQVAVEKIRLNLVDNHIALVYENICRERMWQLAGENTWDFTFSRVGRWWDNKGEEIDVVALDEENKNAIFGECKYWKNPVGVNILQELEKKAALVDWNRNARKNWFILFSGGGSGFTEDLKQLEKARTDLVLIEE